MSDFEYYFVMAWCVAAVVLAVLSWFVAKATVKIEKNKGELTYERTAKQIAKNEKRRKYDGYAFMALTISEAIVLSFAGTEALHYTNMICPPIIAVSCMLGFRYWAFVYYYSKELAELTSNGRSTN